MKRIWGYEVTPAYGYHDSFAQSFTSPHLTLISLDDDQPAQYFWASSHLDDLHNEKEVHERALALKAVFDGALNLCAPEYLPFRLGPLVNLEEERWCGSMDLDAPPTTSPFSLNWSTWNYPRTSTHSPFLSPITSLVFLAANDPVSNDMLRFIGFNGPTWVTLYAMRDFIRQHFNRSEADIASATGKKDNDAKLFTHTANNFAAIGPLARHGDQGWQPPANPMTLTDARKLILGAVKAELNRRIVSLKLKERWQTGEI